MSPWVWAILTALILANSLYVVAEFGAVGVQRSRIRRLADEKHLLAGLLLPFLESPAALDRYVGVSQIGITLASLILGAYAQATLSVAAAPLLQQWFGLTGGTAISVSAVSVLILLTAVQLVVGELVPKAIALQFPTQSALATVLPMRWSLAVFRPFLAILNGAALALLRLVGVSEQSHRHLHSPEEIDLLIAESRDGGLLEPEEQQRLRRALHLNMRTARDLMVARDRVTMVELKTPWNELVRTVVTSPFSRLPVYQDTPDRIVGILRVKDLVERFVSEGAASLESLMRPAVEIPEELAADRVVAELREKRAHAAIVVDASRKFVGLITIQDLLEELLGQRPSPADRPVRRHTGGGHA